jgi:DNA repair protein RadD
MSQFGLVMPERVEINSTEYRLHYKKGTIDAPPTMRVIYQYGLDEQVSEWVCFEHEGFARGKAERWWASRGGQEPVPSTIGEAIERRWELSSVKAAWVKKEGRFNKIVSVEMGGPPSQDYGTGEELNFW